MDPEKLLFYICLYCASVFVLMCIWNAVIAFFAFPVTFGWAMVSALTWDIAFLTIKSFWRK